jgi:hypothetical protein
VLGESAVTSGGGHARVLAALAMLLFVWWGDTAWCARPAPCPGGRFLVSDGSLIVGDSTPNGVVVIQGSDVAIGQSCTPQRAHLHASRTGTRLNAIWRRCTGIAGRVRLRAHFDTSCTTMRGRVAVAHRRRSFSATRSRCGDGVVDVGGGEQCDRGIGCPADNLCSACLCEPIPTTTIPVTTTTLQPPISFAAQVQPIFTQHCALPLCHGVGPIPPRLNLDLDPGSSYDSLVYVTSNECQEYELVVPGDPGSSYMIFKIENFPNPTTCRDGFQMPPGPPDKYPALSASDVAIISTWILQGALDN